MSIINLANAEELAKRLKTLSGDIPSMIEYLKSLKECAKLLGLQISEFYNNHELFIYILSTICDDECPYPNQDHHFWQFRLTDERSYGDFDISTRFTKEFVNFKKSYLKNLQQIKFLYIFAKMKYQTYLNFQYVYYIERFSFFRSCLYKKLLDRKHNWRNRSDWAHQTYINPYTIFRNHLHLVYWTHLYFLNRFTIKKYLIIPAFPSSRRRIFPQE